MTIETVVSINISIFNILLQPKLDGLCNFFSVTAVSMVCRMAKMTARADYLPFA